jgi:hypothetical protein
VILACIFVSRCAAVCCHSSEVFAVELRTPPTPSLFVVVVAAVALCVCLLSESLLAVEPLLSTTTVEILFSSA